MSTVADGQICAAISGAGSNHALVEPSGPTKSAPVPAPSSHEPDVHAGASLAPLEQFDEATCRRTLPLVPVSPMAMEA